MDSAASQISTLVQLWNKLPAGANVVLVLADQSHLVYPRIAELRGIVHEMPELDRADTERILNKLSKVGFLGALRGKPRDEQVHAFLVRARKQLLVALREATAGKGFDAILAGEFSGLAEDQARLAYTIVCLASLHGALGVRRRHLLACLDGTDAEKAHILRDHLRGIVLPASPGGDLLAPRHRLIGRFVAIETAPLRLKRDAIKRFLIQVASEINPESIRKRIPEFIAYRGLINYDGMSELFGEDYDLITEIYEEMKPYYRHDFLFWLQYGRAELEFNNFDRAKNFLDQSLGINPQSNQTLHHLGVLYLKRSYTAYPYGEALADHDRGVKLLMEQIAARGATDPYPYAALLHHKLRFLVTVKNKDYADGIEALYRLACTAREAHPFNNAILESAQRIERTYLSLALSDKADNEHGGVPNPRRRSDIAQAPPGVSGSG